VPLADLKALAVKLTTFPKDFKLHPTVERLIAARKLMGEGKQPLDWGMAENLAYASLIKDGHGVRFSGQDSGRGTFAHRHAVFHDQNRERWDAGDYVPLRNITAKQPNFVIIDSILSEEAVLAFEYGYASAQPFELVIWEAQFGDFVNGAQVVVDQFISSGEAKWGRLCGLTLMLRMASRAGAGAFLGTLGAFAAMRRVQLQISVPSTAAQLFHMLRRQMVRPYRKPLIIMMPKSLLRRKESTSALDELATGAFQPLIGEVDELDPQKVQRVIFCSGKVYFDIVAQRRERKIDNIAVVRLEQLYPFPHEEFDAQIARHPNAKNILWAQEEPANQGAWHPIQHYLLRHLRKDQKLSYAMRPSAASPAVGNLAKHNEQQKALVETALTLDQEWSKPAR
jgi:2-oxoglutarate dehydrogenase E1 component